MNACSDVSVTRLNMDFSMIYSTAKTRFNTLAAWFNRSVTRAFRVAASAVRLNLCSGFEIRRGAIQNFAIFTYGSNEISSWAIKWA